MLDMGCMAICGASGPRGEVGADKVEEEPYLGGAPPSGAEWLVTPVSARDYNASRGR